MIVATKVKQSFVNVLFVGRSIVISIEVAMKEVDFRWMKPRDPARIDRIIEMLRKKWKEDPDLRLGQLVAILAGGEDKVFYIEDTDIEKKF